MLKSMSVMARCVLRFDLGNQLEKEPQLADSTALFHDVHAEEGCDDDGFEDEIVLLGVALRFFENLLKSLNFAGWCGPADSMSSIKPASVSAAS